MSPKPRPVGSELAFESKRFEDWCSVCWNEIPMGTPALHGVRADCTPAPICGPCVLIAAGLVKAHLHDVTTVKPHRATVTLGDVGVLCKGTAVVHEDGRMEFKSDDGKYELQIGPREPPPGRDQPLDD